MSEHDGIGRDEIDDIIGIAAREKQVDEEEVSVAEVKEVAAELDIPAEYVDEAIVTLEEREAEAAREKTRARRHLTIGAIVFAAIVGVIAIGAVSAQSALRGRLEFAQEKRAQVHAVVERREAVHGMYLDAPDSPDKRAALEGSENRIRVEMMRYDEAATAYNRRAKSFPGSLWTTMFGMPDHLPLSNEVEDWK